MNKPVRMTHPETRFTLIELLVVIAIIAILASLLLSTLGHVRNLGRQISCTSNQRNLGIVFNLYSDDYRGYMIPDGTFNKFGGYWQNNAWAYLYGNSDPNVPGNRKLFNMTAEKFTKTVFWCPSSTYGKNELADNSIAFLKYGSYGVNMLAYCYNDHETPKIFLTQLSKIKKPSETIYLTDSSMNGGTSAIVSPYYQFAEWYMTRMRHDSPYSDQQIDSTLILNMRDPGRSNVLLMDGHCAPMRYGELRARSDYLYRQDLK